MWISMDIYGYPKKKNPKKNPHLTGDEKKIFYELTKGKGYIHLKNVFSKKKIEKAKVFLFIYEKYLLVC